MNNCRLKINYLNNKYILILTITYIILNLNSIFYFFFAKLVIGIVQNIRSKVKKNRIFYT